MFGSRKKIYVASSIYNLAGEYSERTNYLKYLTFNGIMNPNGKSVGEHIVSGSLNGPRLNYQSVFKWCSKNYPESVPKGGLFTRKTVNIEDVRPHIPVTPGMELDIGEVEISRADYWDVAEQYVITNHYDLYGTDWDADINEETLEITITFPELTVSFTPTDFDPTAEYLVAVYNEIQPPATSAITPVNTGPEEGPFPSPGSVPSTDIYYLQDEIDHNNASVDLKTRTRVQKTYSDSRPPVITDVETTNSTIYFDYLEQVFERFVEIIPYPTNPDGSVWRVMRLHIWSKPRVERVQVSETTVTTEVEPGVFETVVTTIWEDQAHASEEDWFYRLDEHQRDNGIRTRSKTFRYEMGTGNADLDALQEPPANSPGWFPIIPVRIDNKMIDEAPYDTTILPGANRAWKKVSGGKKVAKLIEQVADNPDLKDIDYAFVTWGVPLNTLAQVGKLYIYHFFKEMYLNQGSSQEEFLNWVAAQEAAENAIAEFEEEIGQSHMFAPPPITSLSHNSMSKRPSLTELRIHCDTPNWQYIDFRLKFTAISSNLVTGKWKANVKPWETKIEKSSNIILTGSLLQRLADVFTKGKTAYSVFRITTQIDDNTYEELTVYGAEHLNYVYGGKAVTIKANEALDDNEDSGFLVPMNVAILKRMPLIRANQLCTESTHIVFNCYVIVKKKWYQTFVGAIFISVLTMGIGAIISGTSIAAASGVLGANAAVGAMFGLSGMLGAVVGALVNATAAVILTAMLQPLLEMLGPLGAVLGAVFGIMLSGGMFQVGGPAFDWSVFMRPENLIRLTLSTLDAVRIYINEMTADILSQITDVNESLKSELRKIEELMYELTGYRSGFDPMALTDVLRSRRESSNTFLSRTLMTGTDIAQLSHDMIGMYAEANLNLENLLEK